MIEVVAGVIYKDNKFLIVKRNFKKSQGGLWEFPGGKVVMKHMKYYNSIMKIII